MAKCKHTNTKKELKDTWIDKDNRLVKFFRITCLDCGEFWNEEECYEEEY